VQHRLGDLRRRPGDGVGQAHRTEDLLLQGDVQRLAGDLLQGLAQDDVVRVRVVPVRPRREHPRRGQTDLDLLLGGPLAEGIGVDLLNQLWVLYEVGVAGRHISQHTQRDLLGVGQVGQPGGQGIVETNDSLVDQPQQERGHIRDGDGPIPEVHVSRGRHAGHRLTQRRGHDLLPVDGHAHDDRLDRLLVHDLPSNAHDGRGLITRRGRDRRRLPQRCGEGGSGRGGRQRAAGKRETHRHRGPTGERYGQAVIGAMNAHGNLLLCDERHGLRPLPRPDDHTMLSPLDLGYILPHIAQPAPSVAAVHGSAHLVAARDPGLSPRRSGAMAGHRQAGSLVHPIILEQLAALARGGRLRLIGCQRLETSQSLVKPVQSDSKTARLPGES
jgi:hypothetical protein